MDIFSKFRVAYRPDIILWGYFLLIDMKNTRASLQVNMITDQNKRQIPRRSTGLIGLFASWLNQPFMFTSSALARFLISFSFGIFVFLFLRIFLPFGLGSIPVNKTLFISVYGVSTTFIISTWLFILPLFSPGIFNKEQYTIRKYLILCFGNTLLIDIINRIYTRTAGADFLPYKKLIKPPTHITGIN